MCIVLVEQLRGLCVVTFAVGVKMIAPSVMTMVLMAANSATASIALVSSAVVTAITAATLGATTARLQRIAASTASTIVVTRLLLAVLLIHIVSFVHVLVLGQFLVLELHAPVMMEVITEFVRIQGMVWIKWVNLLVVC